MNHFVTENKKYRIASPNDISSFLKVLVMCIFDFTGGQILHYAFVMKPSFQHYMLEARSTYQRNLATGLHGFA